MKIDWLKYQDEEHVIAWFLCEVMATKPIGDFEPFNSAEIEVSLTINGIEVDFIKTLDFLQSQLERIKAEAKESVLDTFKEPLRELSKAIKESGFEYEY